MVDSFEKLNCPLCGKEMEKILLHEQGINVDICLNGCGGIFLDNREFDKIDDEDENIAEIIDAIKERTFEEVSLKSQMICPVCNVPMVEMGAGKSSVKIDCCNGCGAKFLENGELQKIRAAEKTNNEEDILLQDLYECFFEDATHGFAPKKSSPRRQAFENFIRRFI